MMRILAKRVNEVEKEMAKETRKHNEGKMSDIDADMKTMSDEDFMKKYKKSKKQMEKELNEDGHTDIPSAIRNCQTIIEDAMQMKQKLETMEGELPSWMTQMIAVAASDLNDARDYLLNPTTESGIMYRAGVKKYGKKELPAVSIVDKYGFYVPNHPGLKEEEILKITNIIKEVDKLRSPYLQTR